MQPLRHQFGSRRPQAAEGMADRLIELHLAVGQPDAACAVAVARARTEQANGNYKVRMPVGEGAQCSAWGAPAQSPTPAVSSAAAPGASGPPLFRLRTATLPARPLEGAALGALRTRPPRAPLLAPRPRAQEQATAPVVPYE